MASPDRKSVNFKQNLATTSKPNFDEDRRRALSIGNDKQGARSAIRRTTLASSKGALDLQHMLSASGVS